MNDDDRALDVTFHLEISSPREASIVFASCGGKPPRNVDYNRGLTLLLERLGHVHATLVRVELDTAKTRDRSVEDRLVVIDEAAYEIALNGRDDYDQLRIGLGRGAGRICQTGPGKAGGNTQRQVCLYLRFPEGAYLSKSWLEKQLLDGSDLTYAARARLDQGAFAEDTEEAFVPSRADKRPRALREVPTRPGQGGFRTGLIQRYGQRCVVSGCEVLEALEAAHISRYRGERDNHLSNGLLLRADLHTLFDANLLAIHPDTFIVYMRPNIATGEYAQYARRRLMIERPERLSKEALRERWLTFIGDDDPAKPE